MERRVLVPDDLYNMQQIGGAVVSPNGKMVAYTLTRIDRDKDKSLTDIYLYDVESERSTRLTYTGQESAPRFSPDSRRLAFISSRNEKSQIYILELGGGEAQCLPTPHAVMGPLAWFPHGKSIAYCAKTFSKTNDWLPYEGAPAHDAERLKTMAERAVTDKKDDNNKQQNEVKVITRFRYRGDGAGYFGDLRKQVFACDLHDPVVRQLTSGDFDHGTPTISPCGRYIITDSRRHEDADQTNKTDLWLFEVESGRAHLLYDSPGPSHSPLWSPCGKVVSFTGHDNRYGLSTTTDQWLLVVESFLDTLARGEDPVTLTRKDAVNLSRPFDRGAGHGAFWTGDALHFTLFDRGTQALYQVTNKQVTPVVKDYDRSLSGFAGAGTTLAYIASTPDSPEELCVLVSGAERCIVAPNRTFKETIALGTWEKICFNSDDGQEVEGWILYPVGYIPQNKYPLMLLIHGGPHSAYGPSFMPLAQQFAGQGYVVLLTNPRGSESYGQDFACVIDKNWGDRDYADVCAGVDAVLARGLVDEENMFVHGWSYGGYLTCWIVTQTNRFKAACAGASVTNMLSGYGTSDITLADEWEYGGRPWLDASHLLDHSPLAHAGNVNTPILLMHGENDLRCHVTQTEEFYITLKRQSKTAVMIRYPNEYHGPRRPMHRVDVWERLVAWFNHYRNQKG